MAELECEILTPTGAAFQGNVEMISVPGAEGELGVLPRHAALVAKLVAGSVRIKLPGGGERAFATSDGYFKVQRDRALVLVEDAQAVEEIDRAAAHADAEDARSRIAAAEGGDESVDRYRAERDLAHAENRLRLAGG
jgi:F-type H+-transporting ATPase subunit epsilon